MGWFELASALKRAPNDSIEKIESVLGRRLTRQQKCSYRAIARLHPTIGNALEELDAPWNIARAVAHAPGPAAQKKLAEQLLKELVERRERRSGKKSALAQAVLDVLSSSAPGLERILAKTRPGPRL